MANNVSLAKGFLKLALPVLALLAIGLNWQSSIGSASGFTESAQSREVRVVNTTGVSGQNVVLSVEMVAQGNENALGFSLNFNPAVFSSPTVALGSGAAGATINPNAAQAASGRLGIALAMPTGQTFAAGTRQLATVTFVIAGNAATGAASITFGDQPIAREVSDANANVLTTTFTAGTITVQQPNPVPAITSLSPNSATAGGAAFTLTVNGTGFVSASTVWWNGGQRATQFVSANQLTASITANDIASAGTANVVVQSPAPGGGSSPASIFTINNPAPAITSLSPNSATAGGAAFTLTVNGTGFVNTSTVWWNGGQRATQFVSATQLTAEITAADIASAGTANVVVQSPAPGGGSSPASTFTINNALPTISSLSPTSATAGGAAFTLTVNGTNFVNTSTVWWNGAQRTTQFVSATQLTASISAADIASAGTANVVVQSPAPGGGSSPAATFTINNPTPAITSLSPASATAGGAAFTLTVNGTGFVSASTVWWNGAQRTTQFVSATQVTASISAADIASAGTASVVVQSPAPGGGSSPAATFTINNPLPTISNLNPNNAVVGGPAFTLTVTGTGFNSSSVVQWNGNPRATQFVSATQLTASILASDLSVALPANVTVANPAPGGGISSAGNFMVTTQPVPIVTSLSPASVTAGGPAFTLTVNGNNFVNGSTVSWNGTARATTFVSANQLTAAITAADIASPNTYTVSITNPPPNGGASLPIPYQVTNPVPVLTSISPSSATAGGAAFNLTVNGTNFVNTSTVWWNGAQRTTTFVSATQLTAAIPAADIASVGTASIVVQTPAPGGGSSSAATFTINSATPAPTTTSITPNIAAAGGAAFMLIVAGTNFTNVSTVNWNGSPRATTFVSATQLTAAIPATDIATAGTASVTVVTPAPGGGTSNAQTFVIAPRVTSVSAASFLGAELAAESIVAAFGVNMATGVAIADSTPLPTMLLGTKVSVKDSAGVERLAPLFFVAPTQVNYQMPQGTANGTATITITSGDGKVSIGSQQIGSVAPGLFTANASGAGLPAANVFRLKANGEQSTEALARFDSTTGQIVAIPIDLGPEGEQVFGIFFGTGHRNVTSLANVTATIGGVNCEVLYAGFTPGFIGLDQYNIRLDRQLITRGDVNVVISVNGKVANTVRINIK
ncbi:MAG: IPT/TIG domain-containing protein [Blastocatellia bacterium]